MSLADLLPEGTFSEINAAAAAHCRAAGKSALPPAETASDGTLYVHCPSCGQKVRYSLDNPYRPFCSARCRLLDLGAWASEERVIAGEAVKYDEDADLLNDPTLPRR